MCQLNPLGGAREHRGHTVLHRRRIFAALVAIYCVNLSCVCVCVYLCSQDLSFSKLHVSCEFFNSDAQWLQPLTEVISHFSCQGLHRSHIYYLQRERERGTQ